MPASRRYAILASLVVAAFCAGLTIYYRQQWINATLALDEVKLVYQQMALDYNEVNQKLNKIQDDVSVIENTGFTKIVLKGTANDTQALASVYWNSQSHEVYVSIQQLKPISVDKQFQLWAIVNGKTVDAGVFDMNFAGLQKMKNIEGAAAFAITIEPRGGRDKPTLETMQVIGSVFIIPS